MTIIKCPYCKGLIDTTKLDRIDAFIKDKSELKNYPNCFENFPDCPKKPVNINLINDLCKICPHYFYSEFKQNKFLRKENNETKELKNELKKEFENLTKEQQLELLKQVHNP